MCGIVCFSNFDGIDAKNYEPLVSKALKKMHSRGPDNSEFLRVDEFVYLGHNRLSIIDLDNKSNQPMIDGDYSIIFNGEIYNYLQLQADLISLGCVFRTQSDTEVVLTGYRIYGIDIFSKLRGMFSVVLYDKSKCELTVARDPLGIKPLYYAQNGNDLVFCSSVRALRDVFVKNPTKCEDAEVLFSWFGFVPDPMTIYEEIHSFEAGMVSCFSRSGRKDYAQKMKLNNVYFHSKVNAEKSDREEIIKKISDYIKDAVSAHLVADTQISLFLSSGVDSNLIAKMIDQDKVNAMSAITLEMTNYDKQESESSLSSIMAQNKGLRHHIFQQPFDQVDSVRKMWLKAVDQPTLDGMNTFILARHLHQNKIKVALTGAGGDELLCGYSLFQTLPAVFRLKRSPFFRVLSHFLRPVLSNRKFQKLFDNTLKHNDLLDAYLLIRGQVPPLEVVKKFGFRRFHSAYVKLRKLLWVAALDFDLSQKKKIMYLEQLFYLKNQLLRDADWAGMHHSVEVRTPLADIFLTEKLLSLESYNVKNLKKRLAKFNLSSVSPLFVTRKKTGFEVPLTSGTESSLGSDIQHLSSSILNEF